MDNYNLTEQEIDTIIKQSIRFYLDGNTKFRKTDNLIISVYHIMRAIFIDNKKYIILEAPTGSGKSVIAYLTNFCYNYVKAKLEDIDAQITHDTVNVASTYMLTSSKMLQNQIEGDIEKFGLNSHLSILKGVKNYECTKLTKETKVYHDYSERFCKGMKGEVKSTLDCFVKCPYLNARDINSTAEISVQNYAYFLNVQQSKFNPFFGVRPITIADEAHLLPTIVNDMFNLTLTQYGLNKIWKTLNQIQINFPSIELFPHYDMLGKCFKFFHTKTVSFDDFREFVLDYQMLMRDLIKLSDGIEKVLDATKSVVFKTMFEKDFKEYKESLEKSNFDDYFNDLSVRYDDIYIESEVIGNFSSEKIGSYPGGSVTIHKHILRDLNESRAVQKYFLANVDVCIFMSATFGNIEEYADLMGLQKDEYHGLRLESNFDFSKSPIFLCQSGYLNFNNFNVNIQSVLSDALRICENLHPKEKGIIHTSTFQIAEMLKQKVLSKHDGVINPKRYLFYLTAEEKDSCIELMKTDTNIPYVIIGPSLYEGIDLPDDYGRFNILVKVPYSGLSNYLKKKIERYPYFYKRETLEKITQAIGRTNRSINDYSKTYLLDTLFNKIIFDAVSHITKRIEYLKIR